MEYKATAIGEAENEIKAMLTSQYNDEITVKEGIRMGINMLKKVLGKGFDIKRVDAAYIMGDEKKFVRMEGEDIKKFTK